MASSRPSRREDFTVALICAIPIEFDAVALAFDEIWPGNQFGKAPGDYNSYTLGRMGSQNAVLVLLHKMGKTSAASATTSLRHSFPSVNLAFLCGVCGGVPSPSPDVEILLGDVIISESVVQYDYGRQYPSNLVHKNTASDVLGMPVKEIRAFLTRLKTDFGRDELRNQISNAMAQVQRKTVENDPCSKYVHPGIEQDVLFQADYLHRHRHQQNCSCSQDSVCDEAIKASCADLQCDPEAHLPRKRLDAQNRRKRGQDSISDLLKSPPRVFVGTVGSGDTVMKSGKHRDRMAQQHGIIAFEMEGAGVWDEIPCIIVKSVCDYADSHKNKEWQGFASVAAASATKAIFNMYNFAAVPTATTHVSQASETPSPAFIVPYTENPDFVGRSEILERVKDLFGHSDTYHRPGSKPRSRVALHGLGGVGKTQIALAYCYWFKERFQDASIFWIHASNVERFQKAFSDIARECEIPGHNDKGVDIFKIVKGWLENRRRGRWLLVIDNADDTEVFLPSNPTAEAGPRTTSLGHSIPECSHGSVLITTRNKQAGLKLTRGNPPPIEIQRMTDTETTQLLRTLLGDESVTPAEASLLSSRLEHLPLALSQAASFILENSTSIKAYVGLLDKSDSSMVDRLSEPFEAVGRDTETPHALTATWAISFKHIEQQKRMASNVLYLMSFFDRQAIPKQFVWDYCNEKLRKASSSDDGSDLAEDSKKHFQVDTDLEVTQALGVLQAFSLISKAGDDLFDMHRLVQLVTRKQLADGGSMSEFATNALQIVCKVFPQGKHENRVVCLQLLPHALAVLGHAEVTREKPLKEDAWLSRDVGQFFRYRGHYQTSKSFHLRSINLHSKVFGPEDKRTTAAMCYLTNVYYSIGRWEEALELALKVLEVDQRLRSEDTELILGDKRMVATALNALGRHQEAEPLCLEVFSKRKETLGAENPDTLRAVHEIVDVYRRTGRLEEAQELCTSLVELTSKVRGEEHPTTLSRMSVLSSIHQKLRNYDDAEKVALKVAEIRTRILGENHPRTTSVLGRLRSIYHDMGRVEEEKRLCRRLSEAQEGS